MVATHLRRRVHWRSVNGPPAERRVLDTLAAFERAVLAAAGETRRSDALLLLSIFRKRALSSMRALGISVERRLAWIDRSEQRYSLDWVQPSLRFDDQPHEDTGDDEREGLTRVSGLDAMRERTWLRRIRLLAAEAERNEAKIARLCRMARLSAEPMVVFTEFRNSLEAIAHAIGRVRDVSLLHGGMTDPERQTAMRQFRDGHTSVLVATDVASQGLNLQERARWVVVFELPWSPARLEQRIGRVDRLGQTRRVHATLLVAAHPMESGTLRRLAARAVHANEAMGGGLFDDFTTDTAVTRALLCGAAIDTPHPLSTSRPRPSCRWQRRAAALRRYLSRRRAFARFWRVSPTAAAARYMTCHTSPAVTGGKETRLSVWSVPIIDSTGRVVERHLVAARVEGGSGTDPRVWLAAVETRARAQLAARLRRLGRVAASRAGRARAVEHAIAAYLMTQQCPEAFQPELFDRRAVRAAWHAAQQQDDIAQTARARVHDSSATATLTIGRASLELVVYARP
jgi:hypothetical protein